ncbi:HNH endonuclease signature motif containing protein [Mycolicibacterium confluentis]|uniref:Uncharacterized protein n=1 Tax=Mycolicibacterium confluentis TaxID=28047 RepID=A0A7I7Y155_9MYCO|nr:HNH endonuclease signature motif containing protein [Mycolicibacterium confluentis]ORV34944.1 hypothetical protein AWB99_04355 [Mycolicibacterium confluentis]BBZ35346.1 hypothetical protein MCNF_39510 [Mycolicibacterium confluentis]
MSSMTGPGLVAEQPGELRTDRLMGLYDELSELAGQRNAIDGRIVEIAARMDGLWGHTGCRSLAGLLAWRLGASAEHAKSIAAIAERIEEFPRCVGALREGQLSLDQVGVIAARAGEGSDEHYRAFATHASVSQLKKAIKLEPRPDRAPKPEPQASVSKSVGEDTVTWRITLPAIESAKFEAGLQSHHEALIGEWKRDHDADESDTGHNRDELRRPPFPTLPNAFMRLVEAGWDVEAAARPQGHRTTVVMHVDAKEKLANLHLGPALSAADRRYLTCDATCEVWFERDGQVIGSGRTTRTISRRLRRALEHRHPTCAVPGCGATRGLHAHHIRHWEDGGETELENLVLLCPYHHRMHHKGEITVLGPASRLKVLDCDGQLLQDGSLARRPHGPPPRVRPYPGTSGERCDWWWYTAYEPPSQDKMRDAIVTVQPKDEYL